MGQAAEVNQANIVESWFEELKRRIPTANTVRRAKE
jgi:hypothetical protein